MLLEQAELARKRNDFDARPEREGLLRQRRPKHVGFMDGGPPGPIRAPLPDDEMKRRNQRMDNTP